ncbi:MAG: hypothetical protein KKD39_07035 [Candidatus Altiarchaeota archaeon]|nr:hypothetical protein [Candidatus Altiarchaeota archaeon]
MSKDVHAPPIQGLRPDERIRELLGEYVRFLILNGNPEQAKKHLDASLNPEKRDYDNLDVRFMSLTYPTMSKNSSFSGLDKGVGVAHMLLSSSGFTGEAIQSLKPACSQLVDDVAHEMRSVDAEKMMRLPTVKSMDEVDRTRGFETEVTPEFFSFMGPGGPDAVRGLMASEKLDPTQTGIVLVNNPDEFVSNRITNIIRFIRNENVVASYIVRIPRNKREVDATLYAASRVVRGKYGAKCLGPTAVVVGDYLIEEDLSHKGNILRESGYGLTRAETETFGMEMAYDLAAMVSDRRFLYAHEKPSTHIYLAGKGRKNVRTRMVGWNAAVDISHMDEQKLDEYIDAYMKNVAYIMRGELRRGTHNFVAWSAFTSTLQDRRCVSDEGVRSRFRKHTQQVERELTNPEYRRGGVPIGEEGASHWREFFDASRGETVIAEDDLHDVARRFEPKLADIAARSLAIDLERSDMLAPEVAKELVDDLLLRVRVQDHIALSTRETGVVVAESINEINAEQSEKGDRGYQISNVQKLGILKRVLRELRGTRVFSSQDVAQPLTMALREVEADPRAIPELLAKVEDDIGARSAGKITFEQVRGQVSWLRKDAKHILVRGPPPNNEIVAIYRFKKTHSLDPSREITPSEIASQEDVGPKVIWSKEMEDGEGLILEEWITPIDPKSLSPRGLCEASENLAVMMYRMFSLDRHKPQLTKSIHSFDGFERGHFNLRRQGKSLKPCLVDFGEPTSLSRETRPDRLIGNLETLMSMVRSRWPEAVLSWAVFETTLEDLASHRPEGSHYRTDLEHCLTQYRQQVTHPLSLTSRTIAEKTRRFLEKVDEVKKSIRERKRVQMERHPPLIVLDEDVADAQERWERLEGSIRGVFGEKTEHAREIRYTIEKARTPNELFSGYEGLIESLSRAERITNKELAYTVLTREMAFDEFNTRLISPETVANVVDAIDKSANPQETLEGFSTIMEDAQRLMSVGGRRMKKRRTMSTRMGRGQFTRGNEGDGHSSVWEQVIDLIE